MTHRPDTAGRDRQRENKRQVQYVIVMIVGLIAAFSGWEAHKAAHASDTTAQQAHIVAGQAHVIAQQARTAVEKVRALEQLVASDEQASCAIQSRGLPAGHALTAAMIDIRALLAPAFAHPIHRTPPGVQAILESLNANLATYVRIENQQPATRTC